MDNRGDCELQQALETDVEGVRAHGVYERRRGHHAQSGGHERGGYRERPRLDVA